MKSEITVYWQELFNGAKNKLLCKALKQPKLKDGRNDPFWYDYNCDKLSELKITGRGNCVAWSNFAVELAQKYGLRAISINIEDRSVKNKDADSHQITVIYERDGTIWYQSCTTTKRLYKPRSKEKISKTEKLLCKMVAKDCGWKRGAKIVRV